MNSELTIEPPQYSQSEPHSQGGYQQPQLSTVQPDVIKPQSNLNIFHISFYSRFFDLNTEDFFSNLRSNLHPANRAAAERDAEEDTTTELYGAIWVTATLVFAMFVSSTASNIVSHWEYADLEDPKYEYQFDLLTSSMFLFYGYIIIVPFAIFGLTRWKSNSTGVSRFSVTKLISIYGYSNMLWFPITIVNFVLMVLINNKKNKVLLNSLEWAVVMATGVITTHGLFIRVKPILLKELAPQAEADSEEARKIRKGILLPLGAVHLGFAALVKISFFGLK